MKMLKPVKGPNESVKKQIIHYNDLNKKNHEVVYFIVIIQNDEKAKSDILIEKTNVLGKNRLKT